jgi:hypothetical protein
VGLTTPHLKNKLLTKCYIDPWAWMDLLTKQHKLRNMDMRFGTVSVRNLYRAGSLMTVSKELSKYKLHSVGMHEVRWDRGCTEPA